MTTIAPTSSITHRRSALTAMYLGSLFTLGALAVAWIDHATADTLARHIRAGYPHYSQARVDSAAATYMIYLSVLGALGLVAWLATIRGVTHERKWIRPTATLVFLLAAGLSLTDLLIRDTSGDTGLPPLLGWIGLLPCLPGLLAVILLWKDRRPGR
jgi:hypothetical protein